MRTNNLGAHYAKFISWEIYSASVALVAVSAMVDLTIIDHLTSTTFIIEFPEGASRQLAPITVPAPCIHLAARTDWTF